MAAKKRGVDAEKGQLPSTISSQKKAYSDEGLPVLPE
jgi:hypothetical protein